MTTKLPINSALTSVSRGYSDFQRTSLKAEYDRPNSDLPLWTASRIDIILCAVEELAKSTFEK
jgi:hypothetical protein